MNVLGIDFTSRPRRSKPIVCLLCRLDGDELRAEKLEEWTSFLEFEAALGRPGPWIAGIDFPFGQSRRFIETIGWPMVWRDYVLHAASLGRDGFRAALNAYREKRQQGDKEHRRKTDVAAGSISPQKLYGVPVGLMFFEGAPRLIDARVTVPHLQEGDTGRIVVEAYPGVLAHRIAGGGSYKQDVKRKQNEAQYLERRKILEAIQIGARARDVFGFRVEAPDTLCDDPGGDHLDALLCAIQAAWAWRRRDWGYGAPSSVDPLEGWIAHPDLSA